MYLAILEKLISYCEVRQDFESGQAFGELLLRQDEARERSYYRLMHLRFLAGDRAGALRLFQRCAAALQRELGVAPSKRTIELYNRVRADEPDVTPEHAAAEARPAGTRNGAGDAALAASAVSAGEGAASASAGYSRSGRSTRREFGPSGRR